MTIEETLHLFFSSFDLPAYEETKVPNNAQFPYLTYSYSIADFDTNETAAHINLYYKSKSNTAANAKALEIFNYVGLGGLVIGCEIGKMWIKRGNPWCQTVADPDPEINRRYINLDISFFIK